MPISVAQYKSGIMLTVLGNTGGLVKAGYTFLGWNTQADGNGISYLPGYVFTITTNITLYANWMSDSETICTLTYDGNGNTGGTVPISVAQYKSGIMVTVLGNTGGLVKTGYAFLGWNTQADGNGISYLPGYVFTITTDTTLYANWMEETSGLSLYAGAVPITGNTYSLTDVLEGYAAQPEATITVNNTGTSPTGLLVIELQGSQKDNFELSSFTLSSIGAGSSSNYTIKAKTGLGVGFYTAIVKVSGADCLASFIVRLNVRLIDAVKINNGSFTMGSEEDDYAETQLPNPSPSHFVTLTKDFYMGKYLVTQEQYQFVMNTNPSYNKISPEGNPNRLPVEFVSWYDAIVFCNKLSIKEGLTPVYKISGKTNPDEWGDVPGSDNATWDAVIPDWNANGYRLPTEAEWEYACRAGTTTTYYTGDTITDNTGWYVVNSGNKTHEVGKKPANAWGLFDMSGNVQEWCWDWYDDYAAEAQNDPKGPVTYNNLWRVLRGGAYDNVQHRLRSACRNAGAPCVRYGSVGFHIVRNAE